MKISSPPKKQPKRKSLKSSEKHMILDVCKTELNPNILIYDIVRLAAYSTGVSESSIYHVIRKYKTTHILKSPKKVKLSKRIWESVDEFERSAIRKKVHDFFLSL
jgi:predicted DNA-binding transcriptional regulator AlpA